MTQKEPMTPKEKAEQLIFYYQNLLEPYLQNINTLRNKSMQCALIAVDEMLKNAGFIWGGNDTETGLSARDKYRKYWQEVKQEIEKL